MRRFVVFWLWFGCADSFFGHMFPYDSSMCLHVICVGEDFSCCCVCAHMCVSVSSCVAFVD
jgi:hypothetical protein